MIPIKLIALVIVTFALAGLMVPAGVSNTAVFAQSADEIIENVESLVSEEITAVLDEDDDDGNDEEVETEEGDNGDGEASGEDSQNIDQDASNEAEVEQDIEQSADETNEQTNSITSGDDNIQVNENEFGDDTLAAVPISDIDQTAANLAVNLDIEIPPTTPTPPVDDGELPPPEEEGPFFCIVSIGILCFESQAECEGAAAGVVECQRFETRPENSLLCTFVGDELVCDE